MSLKIPLYYLFSLIGSIISLIGFIIPKMAGTLAFDGIVIYFKDAYTAATARWLSDFAVTENFPGVGILTVIETSAHVGVTYNICRPTHATRERRRLELNDLYT